MNRLRSRNINRILASIITMIFIGCVTVQQESFRQGLTKQEIQQAWKRKPDKVFYNPPKYKADELWIYKYPDSTIDRYYFKGETVIHKEHVTYGDF